MIGGRQPPLAGLLVADEPECLRLAAALFPAVTPVALPAADFAPLVPFEGPLFASFEVIAEAAASRGRQPTAGRRQARSGVTCVAPGDGLERVPRPQRPVTIGLVVPVVWYGDEPLPAAVLVVDHVNLVGRGPLTGRWPAARARVFPSMAGVYRRFSPPAAARRPVRAAAGGGVVDGTVASASQRHPAGARSAGGAPIYSALAVAGVADALRLTPFERRQMHRCGLAAASSALVGPVVIAAYHGLAVAAVGAPRPPAEGSEDTL